MPLSRQCLLGSVPTAIASDFEGSSICTCIASSDSHSLSLFFHHSGGAGQSGGGIVSIRKQWLMLAMRIQILIWGMVRTTYIYIYILQELFV